VQPTLLPATGPSSIRSETTTTSKPRHWIVARRTNTKQHWADFLGVTSPPEVLITEVCQFRVSHRGPLQIATSAIRATNWNNFIAELVKSGRYDSKSETTVKGSVCCRSARLGSPP